MKPGFCRACPSGCLLRHACGNRPTSCEIRLKLTPLGLISYSQRSLTDVSKACREACKTVKVWIFWVNPDDSGTLAEKLMQSMSSNFTVYHEAGENAIPQTPFYSIGWNFLEIAPNLPNPRPLVL